MPRARIDLSSVTGFDDAGARMLAADLARARNQRMELAIQRPDKLVAALEAAVAQGKRRRRGRVAAVARADAMAARAGGVRRARRRVRGRVRAVAAVVGAAAARGQRQGRRVEAGTAPAQRRAPASACPATARRVVWEGVLAGAAPPQLAQPRRFRRSRDAVAPIDMTRRRAHRLHLRRRAAQRHQPHREPGQGGADHRRDAHRARAAAADRHFAAPLRQEGRTDACGRAR